MEPVTTRSEVPVLAPALYMAIETGARTWKVGFSSGLGQRPRIRVMNAAALERLRKEIRLAKQRFALPEDAPVYSCYEAGRDGFWLHRALEREGVHNEVVDSSSIQVDRRARRAKSDKLDVPAPLALSATKAEQNSPPGLGGPLVASSASVGRLWGSFLNSRLRSFPLTRRPSD